MEAKAAAGISFSAPLHRCYINGSNNLLAPAAARSAQRLRKCWRQGASPLRSFAARSSSRAARVYAAAAADAPAKDQDLVFVAGATGKVGSRTVRELIKLGFRVRAAVRSAARASPLVKSVEQLELGGGGDASARLEVVECDLEKQGEAGIAAAIGGASLVVCAIGASEKEILDVTGPYRIDYVATADLVRAAAAAGSVDHFVLVTSLGTSKIGFPATLLNLFWGVLCWKRRAEEALIASGIPYTIVRPGGMERPTDAYKETHNLVLAPQDTYSGGLVSNLQVAELIACIAKNRAAAYCKVVEVIAETTAPPLPTEDLLARVPSDPGRAPPPPAAAPVTSEAKESPPAAAPEEPAAPPAAKAEQRPLSPYTAYEGLKPPSSPTPSSSSKTKDDAAPATAAPPPPSPVSNRPLSPYTAFVDLKPPASPSPSPPRSAASSDATTGAPGDAAAPSTPSLDSNVDNGTLTTDPVRPLSPYARYEELKPPTSPTPSAPKV